jgi:hypothetical protein
MKTKEKLIECEIFKNGIQQDDFNWLITEYKEDNKFDGEPMDGDDTEKMAEEIATKKGWDKKTKKAFLLHANKREGNI